MIIIKKVRKKMKPITENPHSSNKCGQTTKSTHVMLFLVLIPLLFFVLSFSDGMAKSITSMSILSESNSNVKAGYIDSGKSDYSIASADKSIVANESHSINTIVSNKGQIGNFKSASVTTGSVVSVSPVPTKKPVKKYSFKKTKYVKAASGLNVRKKPTKKSKPLTTYQFGKKIKCASYNKNWVIIKYKKKKGKITYGYLSKKYLQNKKPKFIVKSVNGDRRKSYMDWRCITSVSSPQYKLQRKASTASNGIRTVNGRYCVALGSYYTSKIGKYVDLVLSNGKVIKCVIGDQKADRDTNSQNAIGHDGSAAEFIVTTSALSHKTRQMGDVGYAHRGWTSKVVKVRLYNKNAFSS